MSSGRIPVPEIVIKEHCVHVSPCAQVIVLIFPQLPMMMKHNPIDQAWQFPLKLATCVPAMISTAGRLQIRNLAEAWERNPHYCSPPSPTIHRPLLGILPRRCKYFLRLLCLWLQPGSANPCWVVIHISSHAMLLSSVGPFPAKPQSYKPSFWQVLFGSHDSKKCWLGLPNLWKKVSESFSTKNWDSDKGLVSVLSECKNAPKCRSSDPTIP